jgi:protein-S-isoprenylcysteine O-methyltransferase Ste14
VLVLVRAVIYSSLFIATVLIFVPAQLLGRSGLVRPATIGIPELVALAATLVGGVIAVWCIATFVVLGRGTPLPLDPPRTLVMRGPYRFVRNPMYLGAGLALAGAALFFRSPALLVYLVALAALTHALVLWYEEPTLRREFGADYDAYCRRVHRWIPLLQPLG